jgi:ActR/RegA family two-component response regulator
MSGWVLVVDDDTLSRNAIKRVFEHGGWRVVTAGSTKEALACADGHRFDLVLLDLYLEAGVALGLLEPLGEAQPGAPIIVVTAHGCIPTAVEALQRGAANYLQKPITVEGVVAALERAPQARKELESLRELSQSHIERVLAACNNNKSEAARRLGIARRSLQRRLARS